MCEIQSLTSLLLPSDNLLFGSKCLFVLTYIRSHVDAEVMTVCSRVSGQIFDSAVNDIMY